MWPRIFLYLIIVVLAYWPAHQGFYLWDDDDYVSNNKLLKPVRGLEGVPLEGLKRIWLHPEASPQYYPLVFTTFWVERQLWGIDPMSYHLGNIFLHALNSVLVWLLLRRLEVPGAWLAAAIFALHPVHVESVAWITERKNVLSGFFYLCAFLAYLRFSPLPQQAPGRGTPSPGGEGRRPWLWYTISLLCFIAALLSKTVVCSLPAVLILVYWWKRGWPTEREWLALTPMFLLGAAFAWHTSQLEKYHVGAQGPQFDFTLLERVLIAGRALWFYAGKLVWPHPLIFNYERWTIDTSAAWQYLFPIAAIAVVLIFLAAVPKVGRGPLAALLIFAGTLLPALGFFNVYPMRFSFVADHYQYLASIALIALLVAGAKQFGEKYWPRPGQRAAAACLVLGLLGFLTWQQCGDYASPATLWERTVKKNPRSFLGHLQLGVTRASHKEYTLAIGHFEEATKANPRFADAFNQWGRSLIWLGYGEQARAAEAEARSKKLESLGETSEAQRWLAEANALRFRANKKFKEATAKYRRALELEDDDPRRYVDVALSLTETRDYAAALQYAEKAMELFPTFERYNHRKYDFKKGYPPAEYVLGLCLYKLGRLPEALPHLERALELAPNSEMYANLLDEAEKAKK